jgi:type I restriction enzyme S subunit
MSFEPPPSWRQVELGDVVELLYGFAFKSKDFTPNVSDVRLLRGDNVVQGALRWSGVKRWKRAEGDGLDRYELLEGDVVLAMDRPWIAAGLKYAVVGAADVPSLLVQRVARMRARSGLDQGFLSWLIAAPSFAQYVRAIQTGTAVPHISGGQIAGYRTWLPPLDEQRRIAGVLGALELSIQSLGRRQARLLELSEVVFEEVCRRAATRGALPTPLDELVSVNPRVGITRGEITPFLEMAAVEGWAPRSHRLAERPYSGGCRFEPGDTLMAKITGCIEHGKGAYADFVDRPSAGSTEFHVLRAGPRLTSETTYILSRRDSIRRPLIARMVGSDGRQRVPVDAFAAVQLVVPETLQDWLEEADAIRACFAASKAAWSTQRRLIALRDTLLPEVLTGRVLVAPSYRPDAASSNDLVPTLGQRLASAA